MVSLVDGGGAVTRRILTLDYGAAGGLDDLLSRIAAIESSIGPSPVAEFGYVGVSRRYALTLASGKITQSYRIATELGLLGLDTFGRTQDLHYRNTAAETLFRAEYTSDLSGNRIASRLAQAPVGGQPMDNVRSQVNAYDGLQRLVSTDVGSIAWVGGVPEIAAPVRSDSWNLDLLGNWTGVGEPGTAAPQDAGRYIVGDLDGDGQIDDSREQWHETNARNEILTVTQIDNGSAPDAVNPLYDGAGNLTFDGQYYYQYDAWNRLVQVNQAAWDGQLEEVVIGELVKAHSYDGLGRRIRTQSPYPAIGAEDIRTERFYYDGIRRIQEVLIDPIVPFGLAMGSGDPELEQMAAASVSPGATPEPAAAPVGLEQSQLGPGGQAGRQIEREYIWGPGDSSSGGGVDEILVYSDRQDKHWFTLRDDGGDVVALCELYGLGSQVARVVGQWTYDAYGAVLSAEHLYPFSHPHLGHKGLFLDRLDANVVETGAETPRLVPFAHLLVHVRNREYNPQLGRFNQRDPNETAMTLVAATASHGRGMGAIAIAFDLEGLYGDGANLYAYLGSNPWNRSDPLGLSWDPFSIVDEYLAETAGQKAAFLNHLGMAANAIAVVAATIASYASVPGISQLGDVALYALGEQTEGELALAAALGIVPGGKLISGIGSFIGRIGSAAWGAAKHYASKFGAPILRAVSAAVGGVARGVLGLADRALDFVKGRKRNLKGACGCFAAGTMVWTASGAVVIEDVRIGDRVWSLTNGELSLHEVTDTIVTPGAALLEVHLLYADGSEETIRTTDEHPFFVENWPAPDPPSIPWSEQAEERVQTPRSPRDALTWFRADQLEPGTILTTAYGPAAVEWVRFTSLRTTVHNLSVADAESFLIGDDGTWVHNCFRLNWSASSRAHVWRHNTNDLNRPRHGVFDGDGVDMADEAIARAESHGLDPLVEGSRLVFNVPMGRRIGWEGGRSGSGQVLSTIRLVLTQTGEVVTAYPVR